MEEAAIWSLEAKIGKETDSLLTASRRNQPFLHPDFSPMKMNLGFLYYVANLLYSIKKKHKNKMHFLKTVEGLAALKQRYA